MIYSNTRCRYRHAMVAMVSVAGALGLGAWAGSGYAQTYTATVGGQEQFPSSPNSAYDGPNNYFAQFEAPNGQAAGLTYDANFNNAAAVWDAQGNYTNLSPNLGPGEFDQATGTDGTYQSGFGVLRIGPGGSQVNVALEWAGTGASQTNLNSVLPAAATGGAQAYAVQGNQVVGTYNAAPSNPNPNSNAYSQQAFMWVNSGTPGTPGFTTSGVDLSKAAGLASHNFIYTYAQNTNGTNQVGYGSDPYTSNTQPPYPDYHAIVWSANGTVGTVLSGTVAGNPGLTSFRAYGISGTQIVGFGNPNPPTPPQFTDPRDTPGASHAMVWNTAGSDPIDLNPSASQFGGVITASQAFATDGTRQIGFGLDTNGRFYAMLWFGTAASAVNLDSLLPAGLYAGSQADAFAPNGDILGVAYDSNGNVYYVDWSAVPEPTSLACGALGLGVVCWCARRRRRAA